MPYNIFLSANSTDQSIKHLQIPTIIKALTRSGSSYGLRTVLNLEDEEPSSHSSVDPMLPKITGILSIITYLVSITGSIII